MDLQKEGDGYQSFVRAMDFMDQQLRANGMKRALRAQDILDAHAAEVSIVVQSSEGVQFLEGHLKRVEEAYGKGMRHFQLLHAKDDVVAPLGDSSTSPQHLGGLTAFGADVIRSVIAWE